MSLIKVNKNKKKGLGKKFILISSTCLFFCFQHCFAVMPVVDIGAITQLANELKQLQKQYEVLNNAYKTAQRQLTQEQQLVKDAEGHYGYGSILNSDADLKNREWSPDTWQSALKGLAGGNQARYQQLLSDYQKSNPTLTQQEYSKGASPDKAIRYQQDIQTNQAVNVNTTYAFNDIKTHLENVHQLSQQIEQTQNTKAAMDLNSRLLVELAYIQAQELKMQTLMNEQMAQQSADDIADETAAAKFNAIPKQP